jgi:structural maintenance of chromosome 3 (chondroitin sulfate proteoglycan 6)
MKYLFDRTLICRNLEIATTLARSSKLDCVTCDADFVSHKGLMSGGHVGNISKIELFLDWKNSVSQLEDNKRNLTQTTKQKERNEELLIQESEALSALDIQNNKTKRKLENLVHSKESIRKRLIEMNKKYESFERSIACLEETIPSLVANRDSFNSELKLSLDSQLNENERNEMNKLLKDIEHLKSNHSDLLKKRIEYEKEKSKLETTLDQNLNARQNELEISLIEIKISKFETDFESEIFVFNLINEKINSIRKQFEEKNQKIDELMKQELDIKSSLEDMKSAEDKQNDIVNNEIKKLRKLANKSANSEKKLEECNKKLRNLGMGYI